MEHEMKISADLVRRLRTERGWSQDQLAIAAGLSLRTIQRIEAAGVASMATRVSLAATFGIPQAQLVDTPPAAPPSAAPGRRQFAVLLLGLVVLSGALLSESLRWPSPTAQGMLAINLLFAAVGTLLAAPAAWQLLRSRRIVSVALAVLATPPTVLMLMGLLVAPMRGRAFAWDLLAFGSGSLVLLAMARRDVVRASRD